MTTSPRMGGAAAASGAWTDSTVPMGRTLVVRSIGGVSAAGGAAGLIFAAVAVAPCALVRIHAVVPRTVNGTGHTGPSEFCATSI